MQLFYNAQVSPDDTELRFSKDESRHIVKVLRKSVGDILYITDGKGSLYTAEINIADIKNCVAIITSSALQPKMPYKLHLVVAPTKMNDRYEWFLEKSTEIGVSSITPIICDNSERRIIKAERFEKIIQSAMKQSLNCYLPELHPVQTFETFVNKEVEGQKFIAHCEDTEHKKSLKNELKPEQEVTILIGPEGDFSSNEIEKAINLGFEPVSLGDSRLRTETAAIVACHSVAFKNEL